MYNLDSLTLKYFVDENKNFLNGAVVQKIQMPGKREILLSLRNLGENRKFYININPKFAHMSFISNKENYKIKIPKEPPMFCMLLRKYLEGAKFYKVNVVEFERIVEFYFDIYDEIGSIVPMCLAIELMGKHSNAIIYNANNKIISGCLHNISPEKSSVREIWGGIKYIYPPGQDKKDILKTTISSFFNIDNADIPKNYFYISGGLLDFILNKKLTNNKAELFTLLQKLTLDNNSLVRNFWKENILNEGIICPEDNSLNSLIEAYFSHFVLEDLIELKKNALKRYLTKEIKKQNNIILNSGNKNSYLSYKQKGEAILQNIYKIKKGDEKFLFEGLEIKLDPLKTPSENAQNYFKFYSKGKMAKQVNDKRKKDAQSSVEYLEEILFSVENADDPNTLDEIKEELDEFLNLKNNIKSKNSPKKEKVNVQSFDYKGVQIFVGKNNKQNDFLIKKVSSPEDLWFHAKDCPSGHVIVKTDNGKKNITDEILLYASKLAKLNSPMKNNAKASIIYTKRKFLKRPSDTHLGYVTYREEKEIII